MHQTQLLVVIAFVIATAPAYSGAKDPLELHMKVMGITLEKTTLREAQRILGPAEIRHNGGDAAASASGECYVGVDGTTLALTSNSEMGGGPAMTITEVQLVARGSQPDFSTDDRYVVPPERRPPCAVLKSLSTETATKGGLRLGMTRDEVLRLLGTPAQFGEDSLMFTSDAKVPMTPEYKRAFEKYTGDQPAEDFLTRGRGVSVDFKGGKVIAIQLSQTTAG